MRKLFVIAAWLTGLVVIFSCATTGKKVDIDSLKRNINIGVSTKADVLQVCGEPLTKDEDRKNEVEIWHYSSVEKSITGPGLLTHCLGIGREWETTTTIVDIFFKNDIVVDIKTTTGSSKRMHY